MPGAANSIDETTTGILGFTSTSFTGTSATNHNVILGASTLSTLTNVAPSSTSGVPLISQGAAVDPAFGTMVVAGGGTGVTSFTAYSVITGGTSSTGALQNVSGVGTSGQLLVSNGAGALPAWQTVSPTNNILSATLTLTSAQIKSLNASPQTIVAAPGANKAIGVVTVWGRLNYGGTNAFVATSGTINARWKDNTGPITGTSSLMGQSQIQATFSNYGFRATTAQNSTATANLLDNQPLVIGNSGAEITGNAANNNTMTFIVYYYIISF